MLNKAGIHVLNYDQLDDKQRASVSKYFEEVIFPVLTPLAFDPGHPFPHISNLSLNLAVLICDPQDEEHFARIKVPDTLPRFVPIKRSSGSTRKDGTPPYHHYFVYLEQVIAAHLRQAIPRYGNPGNAPVSASLATPIWRSRSLRLPTCWRPWSRASARGNSVTWCA